MLSEYINKERKQTINREWKYLTPLQRNIIFMRFALGIFPRLALRAWLRYLVHRRAKYVYNIPAHWL